MNRLDRYIARQFLVNVAALLVLFGTLIVTIDVMLNLGRFYETGAKIAGDSSVLRQALATIVWVIDLWGPRLLQLFNYLAGVAVIAAMGFTCSQLVRRRELVAALASGLSLHRLARPFLIVTLGVCALQAINQEFIVPAVAPLLTRDMNDALRRDLKPFDVALLKDGSGRLLYASAYNSSDRRLENLRIWERDAEGRATARVSAAGAAWDGRAWELQGMRVESGRPSAELASGLFVTDLDPTALVVRRFEGYGQSLSWRQISAMLKHAPVDDVTRERFDRIRYGRIATLAGTFLAVVIALPFYLLREPRNMVGQTVKAAPIAGAALVGSVLGPVAAMPGLPPVIGVFVPVLILAPVALWATASVKT